MVRKQPTSYKEWAVHFARKIAKESEQYGQGVSGNEWCGYCGHDSDSGHDAFCAVPEAERFLKREGQP